jgi:hypothetical protein
MRRRIYKCERGLQACGPRFSFLMLGIIGLSFGCGSNHESQSTEASIESSGSSRGNGSRAFVKIVRLRPPINAGGIQNIEIAHMSKRSGAPRMVTHLDGTPFVLASVPKGEPSPRPPQAPPSVIVQPNGVKRD